VDEIKAADGKRSSLAVHVISGKFLDKNAGVVVPFVNIFGGELASGL